MGRSEMLTLGACIIGAVLFSVVALCVFIICQMLIFIIRTGGIFFGCRATDSMPYRAGSMKIDDMRRENRAPIETPWSLEARQLCSVMEWLRVRTHCVLVAGHEGPPLGPDERRGERTTKRGAAPGGELP